MGVNFKIMDHNEIINEGNMIEQNKLIQLRNSFWDFKYIFSLFALSLVFLTYGQYPMNIYSILLGFIFIALALWLLYFKFPKLVLGELALIIFIFSIWFAIVFHDSNILVGGATVVLVLVTSWYAGILYKELEINQMERRGKLIAEIARSIFSPMRLRLEESKHYLVSGYYLGSLKPLDLRLDTIKSPISYLTEEIDIIPSNFDPSNIQGLVTRPAKTLLELDEKLGDLILKEELPEIQKLLNDFESYKKELKKTHEIINKNIIPIWADFKKYCLSIDKYGLSEKEINFWLILHYTIIQQNYTENYSSADNDIKPFINDNKEIIYKWLLESSLNADLLRFTNFKGSFINLIDSIIDKIDNLLSEWEVEYFLTVDETNIRGTSSVEHW